MTANFTFNQLNTLGTMIIVKTSNGDVFINDDELIKLTHDRHNHFVYASMKGEKNIGLISRQIKPIDKVESVIYINDATDKERRDDGSEVAFLRQQLVDEKNMTGFLCQLSEQIEKKLRDFACDIIQMVQYGDDIPVEIRKRLRDGAEEAKAWALDKGRWWERQEYLEKHQKQVEEEVAHTSMLSDKVEHQAARILELEEKLQDAESRVIRHTLEEKRLEEENETITKRNLWQRIFNL